MLLRTLKIRFLALPPTKRFVVFAIAALVLYFIMFSQFFGFSRPAPPIAADNTNDDIRVFFDKPLDETKPKSSTGKTKASLVERNGPKWEDNKHDVAIVVLGYALHRDGMPQRIMKDRVDKASELYYELSKDGIHPYMVLSGKGKGGDYVEAEAMKELALCAGVLEDDILVETKSTSTVENAIFTSKLMETKEMHTIYVVTSDYHVLRSQYIFNTVVPSKVQLKFRGATTRPDQRADGWKLEYQNFASTEGELKSKRIINEQDSYGYHPIRNLPRWKMIEHELENDLRVDPDLRTKSSSELTMVDYGSNYGYFSLQLAQKFPNGIVVSLEGEAVSEYKSAATHHKDKMEELKVQNNVLCKTRTQPDSFKRLFEEKQVYRYQLCLSVFHWFHMPTKEDFETALYHLLSNARTTFIELPEARQYNGKEGQHAWESVNKWYDGRTEVQIIHDIGKKYRWTHYDVTVIGGILHDNKTVRKMIRVDVIDNQPNATLSTVLESYRCGEANTIRFEPTTI